jgi:hypothetical protein
VLVDKFPEFDGTLRGDCHSLRIYDVFEFVGEDVVDVGSHKEDSKLRWCFAFRGILSRKRFDGYMRPMKCLKLVWLFF